MVSFRTKLGMIDHQMGIYSTVIQSDVKEDLNEDNFWRIAEEQSILLHKKIKDNEDIRNIDKSSLVDLLNDANLNLGLYASFCFSNTGKIEYDNDSIIKIDEHYMFVSLRYRGVGGYLIFGVSSMPGTNNLCVSFNFFKRYYSQRFINDLKETFSSIIDFLVI